MFSIFLVWNLKGFFSKLVVCDSSLQIPFICSNRMNWVVFFVSYLTLLYVDEQGTSRTFKSMIHTELEE